MRPPFASDEASCDREAEAGAGALAGELERLEDPLELFARDAGTAVSDPQQDPLRRLPGPDRHRLPAAEAHGVLEHVGQRPLELHRVERAAPADRGRPARRTPRRAPRRPRRRRRTSSSTEHQSARGSTAPACRRDRSSRLSTSRDSRALSSAITAVNSARASRERVSDASPPAAVVIAVSGERRSCDTERSTAVLTTFDRRSAFVSMTCASSSSRRRAAADERLERGDHAVLDRLEHGGLGVARDHHRADASAVDEQRQRAPALVGVRPGQLDRAPTRARTPWRPGARPSAATRRARAPRAAAAPSRR